MAGAGGWRVLDHARPGLRKEKGQWVEGDLWLCALDEPAARQREARGG